MEHNSQSSSGCASHRRAVSRRAFLKVGALGAFGLSLSHYLALRTVAGPTQARAKSVLLLYTMGGISHHDSFDPKPDAPAEVRGEFRTIPTRVPGIRLSEFVPQLARRLDRFALLRAVQHNQTDHGVGAYYMLRGY